MDCKREGREMTPMPVLNGNMEDETWWSLADAVSGTVSGKLGGRRCALSVVIR